MNNFYSNNESIIFNKFVAQTDVELIRSEAFRAVLSNFYTKASELESYQELLRKYSINDLIDLFCKILNNEIDCSQMSERLSLYKFCEQLYDY